MCRLLYFGRVFLRAITRALGRDFILRQRYLVFRLATFRTSRPIKRYILLFEEGVLFSGLGRVYRERCNATSGGIRRLFFFFNANVTRDCIFRSSYVNCFNYCTRFLTSAIGRVGFYFQGRSYREGTKRASTHARIRGTYTKARLSSFNGARQVGCIVFMWVLSVFTKSGISF